MNRNARIYVAGGTTLLGRALLDRLRAEGYENLVGLPPDEPDLTAAGQVEDFFGESRPEYVFITAGASGGIGRNRTQPATLMLDNLLSASHLIHSAYIHDVRKLLYVGSACCYPRDAPQPMRAEALMTGRLEPTNAAYATAKLAGWQLCAAYRRQYGADFVTAIPANSFGPHDDFSEEAGHVIPSLIRRLHDAKCREDSDITVWGTGKPRREFVYAADLADACVYVMQNYNADEPINLGVGIELPIADLAHMIADVVGYRGRICFDTTKPDGMPRKMLNSSPLRDMGWRPKADFRSALAETYAWFLQHEVKEDLGHARAAV
jgi:GDP-L-fucose synthase